jgi:hypothetical protein
MELKKRKTAHKQTLNATVACLYIFLHLVRVCTLSRAIVASEMHAEEDSEPSFCDTS